MLFKKKHPGNILLTMTIIKKNLTQFQHIHVTCDKMSSILDVSNIHKTTANGICFQLNVTYEKLCLTKLILFVIYIF